MGDVARVKMPKTITPLRIAAEMLIDGKRLTLSVNVRSGDCTFLKNGRPCAVPLAGDKLAALEAYAHLLANAAEPA